MKVINLYGAPGAGKSTTASGLFYEMKKHWVEAEYIQEYAKELVWAGSSHMLSQQNYIFAEQEHRLDRLRSKVQVAISDSPLLLSSFYAPITYPQSFHQSVFDFFHSYDNINIFVKRSHEYSERGRVQNAAESDIIASRMQEFLQNNNIPFVVITASDASPKRLLAWCVDQGIVSVDPKVPLEVDPPPSGWLMEVPAQAPWTSGSPIVPALLSDVTTVGASRE